MYKIQYYPEVKDDLLSLPNDVLKEVFEYLDKYKIEPFKYSSKLYNQGGIKLSRYRKTYILNATYRIILCIENNIAKIVEIVEIVAVGKRDNKEVYYTANDRIN